MNRCFSNSNAVSLLEGTGSRQDSRKKLHSLVKFGGNGGCTPELIYVIIYENFAPLKVQGAFPLSISIIVQPKLQISAL